jgi:hypothetical protein
MVNKIKIINNITLARICNDLENHEKYYIGDNGKCYYNNDYIGEISEKLNENDCILDIYFKPIKPIEYITINFTVDKSNIHEV